MIIFRSVSSADHLVTLTFDTW